MTTKVTVVIPCFNEAKALNILLAQLITHLEKLQVPAELILVDDGSTDELEKVLTLNTFQTNLTSIRLIQLPVNRGKTYAQAIGIKNSKDGSSILLMDADGQHPTRYLPEILSTHNEKIRVGSRINYKPSMVNRLGSLMLQGVLIILGEKFNKNESEFVYIPSQYVEKLKKNENLGALPINDLLRNYETAIEYFLFEVDKRFGESLEQNRKNNSRHDFSKLLHKATLIIFRDPWKILSRMILVLLAFTLTIISYGFWIGWHAIMSQNPTGIGTLIVLSSVFFMITWSAIIIILAACLVIREEINIIRAEAK
jgi:glycosyltransferase involved in cell wall biosynthesis